MNLDLKEEQKIIQDTARNFAQTVLEPVAAKLDQQGDRETFLKNLKRLADLGMMGINVRSEYGGSEAGVIAFSLAVTEIARACASTAVTMSVTNMVAEVIQAVGTEEQKRKYIPKLCSGEYYAGGFALTETGAGSDPAGMRTTAIADGDHYVINGNKLFITSAEYAGVFVTWAVTDPKGKKGKNISTFLIENGTKGLTVGRAEHKMGQHASITNELVFEDCRVPKNALMGKLNDGFRTAAGELAGGRIGIGSLGLGCGLAAMDYATRYAINRVQFEQPITNFQAIQWMIAESYTELEAARLLLMNASYKKETGKYFGREASMAKYYATEAAERACYNAIQILGGYGYTTEYPVERYARDVRITSIYEGTNQIQRLIIARDILSALK
ncbi:MAG TPA: acyl-CoA dehydrogenase family protein [Syntrophales bacterium]|nr:acyl-CoA dehydrogenase family protein [Syntrophales bacterium]HOX94940.1 acyl-CoA dehydrogenase family protein [Syntrophales bacterium]HPI58228.1 acyl-CoA dehydrogenase family protein [Syntrophales bacterium]HPN25594.1 acyl-CoA dehydrogenase family protein [Syntrophales bacterium]HQM28148.1 acyl-CoA dehydrogenase family protein [Syntrophales bacterium]